MSKRHDSLFSRFFGKKEALVEKERLAAEDLYQLLSSIAGTGKTQRKIKGKNAGRDRRECAKSWRKK